MPGTLRILLLLTCIPIACTTMDDPKQVPVEQQQAIEMAILDVHARMKQEAQRGDFNALYGHVLEMDKGVIIEDGRLRRTRQEALTATREGMQGLKDLSYSYAQKYITVISPFTALWVGEGTTSATLNDGRQISASFAETVVFIKKGGQWKVLHAHRSIPNR